MVGVWSSLTILKVVEVVVVARRERGGCAADECGREEEGGKRGH